MRKVSFIENVGDIPRASKNDKCKELDEDKLIEFINENRYVLDAVYIGMEKDWSSCDIYWDTENGFNHNCVAPKKSRWDTPVVEAFFKDKESFIFACVKEKKQSILQKIFYIFKKNKSFN